MRCCGRASLARPQSVLRSVHRSHSCASEGDEEIGFYKTDDHWLLWYFAKFPLRHRCGYCQ